MLVKPQFEVGKDRVGAGGVVRDPELRARRGARVAAAGADARPDRAGGHREPAARSVGECGVPPLAGQGRRRAAGRRPRGRDRAGGGGRAPVVTTGNCTVLVTAHTGREAAVDSARLVIDRLVAAGLNVRVLDAEAERDRLRGRRRGARGPGGRRGRRDDDRARRRRHAAARRRARPARPARRCSASTSATSASWPRPRSTTWPTAVDSVVARPLRRRGAA